MKLTVALLTVIFLFLPSLCLSRTLNELWHSWKTRHEKVYVDRGEENVRRQIWIQNRARISTHNRGNHSYTLALNQFADMVRIILYIASCNSSHICMHVLCSKAEHEIREAYLMQDMVHTRNRDHIIHQTSDLLSYPEKWDWREKGFVTDVSKWYFVEWSFWEGVAKGFTFLPEHKI